MKFQPVPLANLEEMRKIEVRNEDEVTRIVLVTLNNDKILEISLEEKDAIELVLVLRGYFKLLTGQDLLVDQEKYEEMDEIAPPYLAQHKVIPEKWSYVDQSSIKQATFAVPPTYQNVNKRTNGLYNTVGRHSKPSLLVHYDLDGNMNGSLPNRNHSRPNGDLYTFQSVFNESELFRPTSEDLEQFSQEHQNINRLTFDSEWQETSVDFDSDTEEGGKLKHSDSLILLNKIKDDKPLSSGANELLKHLQSESDNDSLYTPHDSPKFKKPETEMNMRSNVSFGLRSPNTLDNHHQEFQEYLQRICDMENDSNEFRTINDIFVFDPDIIDLTNIPPPLTPDELDSALSASISVPPRLFADSMERLNMLGKFLSLK